MGSEHTFIIGADFLDDRYTAECSCGWESRDTQDSEADALDAWENHCDVVFMEFTARDQSWLLP